jgi:membrane dipeptidase
VAPATMSAAKRLRRRSSERANSAASTTAAPAGRSGGACGGAGSAASGGVGSVPSGTAESVARVATSCAPHRYRAETMTHSPFWADGHLDLAYLAVNGRDMRASVPDDAPHALTLASMRQGGVRVALGTIFTELGGDPAKDRAAYRDSLDQEGAHRAGLLQLEWYEAMERAGEVAIVRTRGDLARAAAGDGPPGLVILMECADPIRSPDEVAWWHARGLRVVGMSWGHGSRYAGGNARTGGLTDVGRRFVEALDACGVLHDASHLSRAAFDDLLAATDARVIASHSNAQALLPESERHITDAQIGAIRDRGGWIGLNLYGRFLAADRRATIHDCVAHTMHVARIAGADRVGLGSDLDGGFGRESLPLEVQSTGDYAKLLEALDAAGFAALGGTREGFAHANLLRVLEDALPA